MDAYDEAKIIPSTAANKLKIATRKGWLCDDYSVFREPARKLNPRGMMVDVQAPEIPLVYSLSASASAQFSYPSAGTSGFAPRSLRIARGAVFKDKCREAGARSRANGGYLSM
jgi:hypothetical protein